MLNIEEIKKELLNKLFSSNVLPRVQFDRNEEYSEEYSDEELNSRIRGLSGDIEIIDITPKKEEEE